MSTPDLNMFPCFSTGTHLVVADNETGGICGFGWPCIDHDILHPAHAPSIEKAGAVDPVVFNS